MNCHNSEKYLKEAINSVYCQTYKNWEIIFLDNVSTDSSASIAKSYNEKLKYYKTSKYEPLYKARNIALDKCSGNLIGFLDCDDVWIFDKLAKQIEAYNQGYLFTFGGSIVVDENKNILYKQANTSINKVITTNSLLRDNSISIGCAVVEERLIKELKFDPFYELLGDFDLWIRLSLKCTPKRVQGNLELSRRHDKNITNIRRNRWLTERRYFYRKFIKNNNFLIFPSILSYILLTEVKGLLRRI